MVDADGGGEPTRRNDQDSGEVGTRGKAGRGDDTWWTSPVPAFRDSHPPAEHIQREPT
jgi:hypothetical protein